MSDFPEHTVILSPSPLLHRATQKINPLVLPAAAARAQWVAGTAATCCHVATSERFNDVAPGEIPAYYQARVPGRPLSTLHDSGCPVGTQGCGTGRDCSSFYGPQANLRVETKR